MQDHWRRLKEEKILFQLSDKTAFNENPKNYTLLSKVINASNRSWNKEWKYCKEQRLKEDIQLSISSLFPDFQQNKHKNRTSNVSKLLMLIARFHSNRVIRLIKEIAARQCSFTCLKTSQLTSIFKKYLSISIKVFTIWVALRLEC